MFEINYDDRKCACCERVYVNSLILECKDHKHFILCPDCANIIYVFVRDFRTQRATKEG